MESEDWDSVDIIRECSQEVNVESRVRFRVDEDRRLEIRKFVDFLLSLAPIKLSLPLAFCLIHPFPCDSEPEVVDSVGRVLKCFCGERSGFEKGFERRQNGVGNGDGEGFDGNGGLVGYGILRHGVDLYWLLDAQAGKMKSGEVDCL